MSLVTVPRHELGSASTLLIGPPVETATGRIAPRPILLIQDGADQIAPPSETAELLEKAGPNTTFWFVPGAGHVGAFCTQQAEYTRRVQTFFERALATP